MVKEVEKGGEARGVESRRGRDYSLARPNIDRDRDAKVYTKKISSNETRCLELMGLVESVFSDSWDL
ncbi:hypothetical protein HZH66_012525 [Vespula vulgaris]|uniref:Uncharacterized protein n=1 Tax=Vespula vulgaris TaxID=7454 RepID=A0A834MTU3_VESVU|nr:hypothetical protein HZH66_012525 [Vespula vulgaris]